MPLGFQDNPGNPLGTNSANNQFDSSLVAANADGSILERLEAVKDQVGTPVDTNISTDIANVKAVVDAFAAGEVILQGAADAGTNSTTVVPIAGLAGYGDDFFNTQFYLQVLHNNNSAGNAPEHEVRQITDYVSTTGTFTCSAFSAAVEASDLCLILHESSVMVGRDDANNTAATTNVAANVDGSVLERLEDLKDRVNTIDDFIDTEIAAIKAVTDVLPDAGALTTISGKIDTIDNYIDGANLEKLSGVADGGTHAYPDSVAQDSVLAYIMAKGDPAVITSFDNTTDSLEAISDKINAVDDYIDGANLELLTSAADGGGNAYPDSVAQESVVAYILSKSANPVTTSYNNTTDSLEAISDKIDTIDDYIDGANLEKLTGAADGGTHNYPDAVAQDSVLAYVLSKADPAVTTSYDNTTDSLEAISDKVTALTNTYKLDKLIAADDRSAALTYPDSVVAESILAFLMSKSASPVATSFNNTTDSLEAIADAVAALTGTLKLDKLVSADDSAGATAYPDSVAQDSILAYLMSKSASPVTTSYNNTTDSLEAISDKIGTPVNTGGSAEIGGILGDFANIDLITRLGAPDGATTESLNGKLGTDTELADRSLYDILNGGGPAAAAAAAAPANDVSLYGALRAVYNLSVPAAATGETVIDEGDYDWTSAFPALLTIAPAAGAPLADVVVYLDMDHAVTGFATVYAAQTISLYVERKIDGTNWRREIIAETALAGDSADNRSVKVTIGDVGITQQVRIVADLSAEVSGVAETDIPYAVYYKGLAAPTITPLTATA